MHPHCNALLINAALFLSKPRVVPVFMMSVCPFTDEYTVYEAACICVCKTSRIFILLDTKVWFKFVTHSCLPPFIEDNNNIFLTCIEHVHDFNMTLKWETELKVK